jgi:hypothetical protein
MGTKNQKEDEDVVQPVVKKRKIDDGVVSFGDFCTSYRANRQQPQMAETTESEIVQFFKTNQYAKWFHDAAIWKDQFQMDEVLDQWLQTISSSDDIQPKTKTKYARNVLWYARYMLVTKQTTQECIKVIEEMVADLQASSSKHSTAESMLLINDPDQMIALGNKVMCILLKTQRDEIDPFVKDQLLFRSYSESQLENFGFEKLMPFIELSLRFQNLPARIQCSVFLEHPESTSSVFVSKLSYNNDGTTYKRIFSQDKVSGIYPSTSIPIDVVISAYISFYLEFCSKRDTKYVFSSKHGSTWNRASRDVKIFLRQRNFDPDLYVPNGRFIHFSRSIMLAFFAKQVDFDRQKIQNFCTLLRHNLETSEKYYSPWIGMARSKKAIEDYSAIRGDDATLSLPGESITSKKTMLTLQVPADIIMNFSRSFIQQRQKRSVFGNVQFEYSKKTVGCQTDPTVQFGPLVHDIAENCLDEKEETVTYINGSSTGICCELPRILKGPGSNPREMNKYGKFWFTCHLNCKKKPDTVFPLGEQPKGKVHNVKPRNLKKIVEYVLQTTGKRITWPN